MNQPKSTLAQPAVTEHGGRVELRWDAPAVTAQSVAYTARWFLGATLIEGSVVVHAPDSTAKALRIELQAPDLPEWMVTFTQNLLRTTARSLPSYGATFHEAAWPRRLTRWRKSPSDESCP